MFQFHAQNAIGKRGEELFLSKFPGWKPNNVAKCTEPDFIDAFGRKAEIKFDVSPRARRDRNGNQLNFFMEAISNDRRGTPGGIFRAHKEGVQYYVYMFENPSRIFILDVPKALQKTTEMIQSGSYRKCSIRNPNYNTIGYPLPIEAYQYCMVHPDVLRGEPAKVKNMRRRLECTLENIIPKNKSRI